jgi:hypothetical protein
MGFDIKKVLGTVAPFLTAALPGPFAGIANAALGSALGLQPGAKPSDVQAAIDKGTLSGDQLVAVKAAEMDFQKTMAQLGYEDAEKLAQLTFEDRASARDREVKLGGDWTARVLAYSIVGAFIFVVIATLRGWSHADSVLAGSLIGYLSAKAEQVVAYYFGSSAGSDKKTDLLAQAPAIDHKD